MREKRLTILVASIIVLAVLVDQALKFYIKLHFTLGEAHEILPFFFLCFVENDGMAFGIEWFDKLFLTLFRIAAVGLFGWYIHRLIHNDKQVKTGFLVMVALVTAGALGNIIDCMFYGLIFSASTPYEIATFLPTDGGYAPFFYGKVVDMLYFPLIHNAAGETIFFRPVFNIADSCITVAMFAVIIFYMKELNRTLASDKEKSEKE